MYLLDTNHCSELIDQNENIIDKLIRLGATPVATSVVSRGELLYGVLQSQRRTSNMVKLKNFLGGISIYGIDDKTADIFGELKSNIYNKFAAKVRARRKKQKLHQIGFTENDLWIASIAKRWDFVIVSNDKDFNRISEVMDIQFESWV